MKKITFLLFPLLVCSPGCATIFNGGGEKEIRVDSIPRGADVLVEGVRQGKTPMTVTVKMERIHSINFRHPKYAETGAVIKREAGWGFFFLNLVSNLGVGNFVDLAYGTALPYTEDDIVVPLLRKNEDNYRIYDENVLLVNVDKARGK